MNVTGNIECLTTAVSEGVALLDQAQPDWWKHINLDTLDMSACYSCILGQLYGSYAVGREDLGIKYSEGDLYGFDSLQGQSRMTQLQFMWVEIIENRRASSKA